MLANQPHCYQSITFPNFERPIGLELEPVKLELKTRQNELSLDVMLSLLAISILFFARNASLSVYIIITFFATWLPSIFTQKMHSVKWSLRIVAHPKKVKSSFLLSYFLFLLLGNVTPSWSMWKYKQFLKLEICNRLSNTFVLYKCCIKNALFQDRSKYTFSTEQHSWSPIVHKISSCVLDNDEDDSFKKSHSFIGHIIWKLSECTTLYMTP